MKLLEIIMPMPSFPSATTYIPKDTDQYVILMLYKLLKATLVNAD